MSLSFLLYWMDEDFWLLRSFFTDQTISSILMGESIAVSNGEMNGKFQCGAN